MICHKHKIIFVHIQRTGGTAVEKFFIGEDQFKINKEHKHLLASQAKKLYKDYWNDYFKFSIVRDPWARTISMMSHPKMFFTKIDQGKINLDGWVKDNILNDTNVLLENDWRFSDRSSLFNKEKHLENQVYLNLLDEELDFIANFDTLHEDIKYILEKNNLKSNLGNFFKKPTLTYEHYYTEKTKQQVYDLYENDIKFFNFRFDSGKLLRKY